MKKEDKKKSKFLISKKSNAKDTYLKGVKVGSIEMINKIPDFGYEVQISGGKPYPIICR
jgi:hypothetical protein